MKYEISSSTICVALSAIGNVPLTLENHDMLFKARIELEEARKFYFIDAGNKRDNDLISRLRQTRASAANQALYEEDAGVPLQQVDQ